VAWRVRACRTCPIYALYGHTPAPRREVARYMRICPNCRSCRICRTPLAGGRVRHIGHFGYMLYMGIIAPPCQAGPVCPIYPTCRICPIYGHIRGGPWPARGCPNCRFVITRRLIGHYGYMAYMGTYGHNTGGQLAGGRLPDLPDVWGYVRIHAHIVGVRFMGTYHDIGG
jgi:hypothetical protein